MLRQQSKGSLGKLTDVIYFPNCQCITILKYEKEFETKFFL